MELGDSTGLFVGLFLSQWERDHMGRAQPCIPGFPQHQPNPALTNLQLRRRG